MKEKNTWLIVKESLLTDIIYETVEGKFYQSNYFTNQLTEISKGEAKKIIKESLIK